MKFYISVDMEGLAGVVSPEQLTPEGRLYHEARRLLTREVNVIVEMLAELGAEKIIVKDAHYHGLNLLLGELSKKAQYVLGGTGYKERFPGLDETFHAALLIGYHGKAGAFPAIRDHTISSKGWQMVYLNQMPLGEIALDALLIGVQKVPVALVSGDQETCREAREVLGETVMTLTTKTAINRHAALIEAPEAVYERYRIILKEIVQHIKTSSRPAFPVYELSPPYTLTIRFFTTEQADARRGSDGLCERVDAFTVSYTDDDLLRLLGRAL
ncbi:MAG: D-aminopeptidase dipeptide-binding protein DppA [Candidatus Carbobacillus altaicus]|uniref:D-aminopeptidase dipeptide-binding protein DppA n=1 Tax=Candidatus Carbonibacillus altaicus TaxID=2163959 RepID=A0A2R6Y3W8_9BACL|nr:MAG: D-aminopeptidase dipeptide-binding protein DppA [Candidatus Carbobacillus altaicus]